MSSRTKVVLALSGPTERAMQIASKIARRCHAIKIHSLLDREGGEIILRLLKLGARPFVDHKIHEIPEEAAERAAELALRGAQIITVDANGGVEMMGAVVDRLKSMNLPAPVSVWASTVLTSLNKNAVERIYATERTIKQIVYDLSSMAREAGADGVVCSSEEAEMLKKDRGFGKMDIVTPGIRPLWANLDDQKRFSTPRQANDAGADLLIVGRPVMNAENPEAAFDLIVKEIGTGDQLPETPKSYSERVSLH
ncbi:MAG: orotidine-5'-phosphate decarboxylase [Minisyncoccota bacterium]